ncbi:hypothetical protein, partial [Nocardia brasiliensis]|uniref:hypothetical protein n=1 Tax=Nocardia brasiliensis TaxID=37326 RepID=UPI002457A3F8
MHSHTVGRPSVLRGGTVLTMDSARTVLDGHDVLVVDGRIAAQWGGGGGGGVGWGGGGGGAASRGGGVGGVGGGGAAQHPEARFVSSRL